PAWAWTRSTRWNWRWRSASATASSCARTTTRTAGSSPRCVHCRRTSSRTRRPEPPRPAGGRAHAHAPITIAARPGALRPFPPCPAGHGAMTLALQALLALASPVLAHLSSALDSATLGAAALGMLALMLVLAPLLRLRWWAWLVLAVELAGVLALHRAGLVRAPMLLVPVAFVALIAWWFARSLRAGRVPLITRIVSALDGVAPEAVAAAP